MLAFDRPTFHFFLLIRISVSTVFGNFPYLHSKGKEGVELGQLAFDGNLLTTKPGRQPLMDSGNRSLYITGLQEIHQDNTKNFFK